MCSPATRPLRAPSRRWRIVGRGGVDGVPGDVIDAANEPALLRSEPRHPHLGVDVVLGAREGRVSRQDELAGIPKTLREGRRGQRRPPNHRHRPRAAAADVAADCGHDLAGRTEGRPRAARDTDGVRELAERRRERDAPQRRGERRWNGTQRPGAVAPPAAAEGVPVRRHLEMRHLAVARRWRPGSAVRARRVEISLIPSSNSSLSTNMRFEANCVGVRAAVQDRLSSH